MVMKVRHSTMKRNVRRDVRGTVKAMLEVFEVNCDPDRVTDMAERIQQALKLQGNGYSTRYRTIIETLRKERNPKVIMEAECKT